MDESRKALVNGFGMSESADEEGHVSSATSNGSTKQEYEMLIQESKAEEADQTSSFFNKGLDTSGSKPEEKNEGVKDSEDVLDVLAMPEEDRWLRNLQCAMLIFCLLLLLGFLIAPVVLHLKHAFASGKSEYNWHMNPSR